MRSGGANVTDKHITDISMCALFLLEAAKKCDKVFGVPPSSAAHTVRDSKSDIEKITSELLERGITKYEENRTTPLFLDPTEKGLTTLTNGEWLQTQLSPEHLQSEEHLQGEEHHDELTDIDYELADIV